MINDLITVLEFADANLVWPPDIWDARTRLLELQTANILETLVAQGELLDLGLLGDGWREYRLPPATKKVKV